jgi:pyruvate/2-oxoglutarate dehydrogenase complex dihydrolipoamide acyltransferase (E2) component
LLLQTTIPHAYAVTDCTVDKLIALRKQLKEDGIKVSVNDFVIRAVALALQQCPQVNALYKGEEVCFHLIFSTSTVINFQDVFQ